MLPAHLAPDLSYGELATVLAARGAQLGLWQALIDQEEQADRFRSDPATLTATMKLFGYADPRHSRPRPRWLAATPRRGSAVVNSAGGCWRRLERPASLSPPRRTPDLYSASRLLSPTQRAAKNDHHRVRLGLNQVGAGPSLH